MSYFSISLVGGCLPSPLKSLLLFVRMDTLNMKWIEHQGMPQSLYLGRCTIVTTYKATHFKHWTLSVALTLCPATWRLTALIEAKKATDIVIGSCFYHLYAIDIRQSQFLLRP